MDTQAKAREARMYVCMGMNKVMFFVPKVGEDGKPIYQVIPATGQIRFVNNKPVPVEERRLFTTAPHDKKNPLDRKCFYVLTPDDKTYDQAFAVLEGLSNDPASGILRKAEYEKRRNPSAFEEAERRKKAEADLEVQREVAQNANVKAETLKTEILVKDEALIKAQDELSEKDRQLAEARDSMAALMRGDTTKRKAGRPPKTAESITLNDKG
jgi:hypothetical protein